MRLACTLLALLMSIPAAADDSPLEVPKKARKKPRPRPTPTPMPDPEPTEELVLPVQEECPECPEVLPEVVLVPVPAPAPSPVGVLYEAQLWAEGAAAGETETAVKVGGRLAVDGPIAFGRRAPLRLLAQLDIAALPGQEFSFTDPGTFGRSVEATIGLAKQVGRLRGVRTSVTAQWGFATVLRDEELDRFLRKYGVGIRFEDREKGGYLDLTYGRNEAAGTWGLGQWMLDFSFPLGFTKDVAAVGGSFILSVGPDVGRRQRDVYRLRTVISLPDLVEAF